MSSGDLRFLEFGPFRFDVRNRRLTREGQLVALTPKAADLLLALLNGRGDVVSKEDLLRTVWADTFVEEGNLGFHIHAIREALREGTNGHPYIENVPRRGYRFAAPIRELSGETAPLGATPSVVEGGAQPVEPSEKPVSSPRRVLLPVLLMTMIVTVIVAAGGAVALHRSQTEHLRVVRYQQLTTDRREKNIDRPLLTDGSHVFFRQEIKGPASWVAVTGGETTAVTEVLRDFFILDVHPTRHEYLVVRRTDGPQGQLWIASKSGSSRKVGTITCRSAAWSPDGQRIAYTTESGLHVVGADGTESKRIALFEGIPDWPRWSPDGHTLRFTLNALVDRVARQRIWEIDAGGSRLHPLSIGTTASNECCGTWTPDGEHFVFESRREGRADLWTLTERKGLLVRTGSELEPLTIGPLSFSMPGMATDGTQVFAVGIPEHGELVRFDKTLRTFVPYLDGISALWIDFSHDRQSVVYVRYPEGTLWRAQSDGSHARQLTFSPMQADGCSWSPDGKWIAFRGSMPGRPYKVLLIPADGGEAKPLIEEDREQGIPSWSADGTRLAFGGVPSRYGFGNGEVIQIYAIPSRQFSMVPGSTNLWTPRWSPDGRYISAVTITGRSLRLFDVMKGAWREFDADHIDNPTWSKDSKFIYYHTEGGVRWLRRIRIPDGLVEEIASLDGFPLRAYWWSGLAADDSPLVLRNPGGPEIYALDLERR
jgi:Tol biopolymer transport system component/DNA-binding winged helix-turn-helix (wHTH) protein